MLSTVLLTLATALPALAGELIAHTDLGALYPCVSISAMGLAQLTRSVQLCRSLARHTYAACQRASAHLPAWHGLSR